MTTDTLRLETVATFADPLRANYLAKRLNENGVQAEVTGEATAGVWTENLNDIQVVVRAGDLKLASAIAEEFSEQQSAPAVDWSQIDVGDSTEIENEEARFFEENESRRSLLQFPLSSLIKLQLVAVFVAALVANAAHGRVTGSVDQASTIAILLAVAIISIFPAATVFGITKIAGHRHSASELVFLGGLLWVPAFFFISLACF